MRLKMKSSIDGEIVENEELNLKSDNVRNCEEAIPFVKITRKLLSVRRKESSICRLNNDFYIKNSKRLQSLKKC